VDLPVSPVGSTELHSGVRTAGKVPVEDDVMMFGICAVSICIEDLQCVVWCSQHIAVWTKTSWKFIKVDFHSSLFEPALKHFYGIAEFSFCWFLTSE
jgi:hypothetical protein